MSKVTITIDSRDRLPFNRVYANCLDRARIRVQNEIAHADILPIPQINLNDTISYLNIPTWFHDEVLSDELQRNGIKFSVGRG